MMTNTCHQASILEVFLQCLLSLFICCNKQILTSIIHTGNNLQAQATDDLASCSIPRLMLFHLIPLAFLQPQAHLLQPTLPLFSIAAWHSVAATLLHSTQLNFTTLIRHCQSQVE